MEDFLLKDDPCYEYALAALDRNEIFPTFEDFPRGVYEQKIILEHCGLIDPLDIDHYIARDGYAALASALEMGAEKILQEVRESGLRGRGGAGFPAAVKWESLPEGRPGREVCHLQRR